MSTSRRCHRQNDQQEPLCNCTCFDCILSESELSSPSHGTACISVRLLKLYCLMRSNQEHLHCFTWLLVLSQWPLLWQNTVTH